MPCASTLAGRRLADFLKAPHAKNYRHPHKNLCPQRRGIPLPRRRASFAINSRQRSCHRSCLREILCLHHLPRADPPGLRFAATCRRPEEDQLGKAWGLEASSRLSCQVRIGDADLVVEIPRYTLNFAGRAPDAVDRHPQIAPRRCWTLTARPIRSKFASLICTVDHEIARLPGRSPALQRKDPGSHSDRRGSTKRLTESLPGVSHNRQSGRDSRIRPLRRGGAAENRQRSRWSRHFRILARELLCIPTRGRIFTGCRSCRAGRSRSTIRRCATGSRAPAWRSRCWRRSPLRARSIAAGVPELEIGIPIMGGPRAGNHSGHCGLGPEGDADGVGPHDRRGYRAGGGAQRRDIVNLSIPGVRHPRYTTNCKPDASSGCRSRSAAACEAALDAGCEVSVGAEDASRADTDFLVEAAEAARAAGARRFRFADTLGVLDPAADRTAYPQAVRRRWTSKSRCTRMTISGSRPPTRWRRCNAGATHISTTVNGLGERAGNAPLEEAVMALRHLYDIETGVDSRHFPQLSQPGRPRSGTRSGVQQEHRRRGGVHARSPASTSTA